MITVVIDELVLWFVVIVVVVDIVVVVVAQHSVPFGPDVLIRVFPVRFRLEPEHLHFVGIHDGTCCRLL